MAAKDRKAREADLLAAARREAAGRMREAPLTPPTPPASAPRVRAPEAPVVQKAAAPAHTVQPVRTIQPAQTPTPSVDPGERLALLMQGEREERERRQKATRRNALIAFAVFSIPVLLWLLASVLKR